MKLDDSIIVTTRTNRSAMVHSVGYYIKSAVFSKILMYIMLILGVINLIQTEWLEVFRYAGLFLVFDYIRANEIKLSIFREICDRVDGMRNG